MTNLGGFAFVLRAFSGGVFFMWLFSFVITSGENSFPRWVLFLVGLAVYFVGWQLDKLDKERNGNSD